jgi:hypothetical protein
MPESIPHYNGLIHDNRRWDGFAFRPGDIIVTTPPKCGTTWMQRICSLLVFGTTELERPVSDVSPWLEMLTTPIDEIVATLDAQRHRRFIKSHTPLDGLPMRDDVHYVCVARDPRDAGVSWYHHAQNIDMPAFLAARERTCGNDDLEAVFAADPPYEGETLEERFWAWVDHPTDPTATLASLRALLHHCAESWRHRDRPNVHLFHYADLKADLDGEMRRLAKALTFDVDEAAWPSFVEAAGFERMKQQADLTAPDIANRLWKDNERFFHAGRGEGWRDFFDDAAQARFDARVAGLAPPDVAAWVYGR